MHLIIFLKTSITNLRPFTKTYLTSSLDGCWEKKWFCKIPLLDKKCSEKIVLRCIFWLFFLTIHCFMIVIYKALQQNSFFKFKVYKIFFL